MVSAEMNNMAERIELEQPTQQQKAKDRTCVYEIEKKMDKNSLF